MDSNRGREKRSGSQWLSGRLRHLSRRSADSLRGCVEKELDLASGSQGSSRGPLPSHYLHCASASFSAKWGSWHLLCSRETMKSEWESECGHSLQTIAPYVNHLVTLFHLASHVKAQPVLLFGSHCSSTGASPAPASPCPFCRACCWTTSLLISTVGRGVTRFSQPLHSILRLTFSVPWNQPTLSHFRFSNNS